jgi:Tfp pilus assembly protein PilF
MAGRLRWGVLIVLVLLQPGCVLFDTSRVTGPKPPREPTMLPATESARACQTVAESLARQGHLDQAIEQLLKAREFDPKADVCPALARLYAKKGLDKLARDEFTQALQAHPQDSDLWNDLGYDLHYQRGNWAEAEQNFRKATEVAPKNARAWVNLGLALGQQGKYPEALAAFEKAVRPAEARCNLAFVLWTQGKRDQARELYREALEMDPGLELARAALARMERPPVQKPRPGEPGMLAPEVRRATTNGG